MNKMKFGLGYLILAFGVLMLTLQSCAGRKSSYYIGFENAEPQTNLSQGLSVSDGKGGYKVYVDSLYAHTGKRSLVIACKNKEITGDSFGEYIIHIPAVGFKGSQVTLVGYIKTEMVERGYAGLVLKIEGDGWNFSEQMKGAKSVRLQGTCDWTRYEINIPMKVGVRNIYIGAYNMGSGKVWVDDLELLVDGKAPQADGEPGMAPALKDTSFMYSSHVLIDSLSPQLREDLVLLGKIWGFLKYYHPSVAAGRYNWDAELFRILPKIVSAINKTDRNRIILNWLKDLGPYELGGKLAFPDSSKVKIKPDLDWLEDRLEMGDSLSLELESIRGSTPHKSHFYLGIHSTGNPDFRNESNYRWLDYPDDGYRLLALYRYWNIIQYFYPYKHLIRGGWMDKLNLFIPQFIHAKSSKEYQLTVLKLISTIGDSHANVTDNTTEIDRFMGKYLVPAEVRFIEGEATVVSVPQEIESKANGLLRGDVILKVNGMTVKEIQERLEPYISASNEPQKLLGMATKILRGNDSAFSIEVRRNKKAIEVNLFSSLSTFTYPTFDQRLHPQPWKILPGNVGYAFLGTLKIEDIPQMMKEFVTTEGIVIDLRCYPLDPVGGVLSKYFTDEKVEFTRVSYPNTDYPGLFVLRSPFSVGGGNAFPYRRKVAVLVNEFTESRGEFVAMALKAMPNVTIIGSQTAGTDGDVSEFSLPGGLRTRISGLGIYWPDGSETQRVGIKPDIMVQPTLNGVRSGEDEVLVSALSYLKNE